MTQSLEIKRLEYNIHSAVLDAMWKDNTVYSICDMKI